MSSSARTSASITHCCGKPSTVLDSRLTATTRRRRRECPKCGNRWTTFEVPDIQTTLARAKIAQAAQKLMVAAHALATVDQLLAEVLQAIEYSEGDDD